MNKIIIGVTPRLCSTDSTKKQGNHDDYINEMNKLGFIPITLPLGNTDIKAVLDICDGFLLPGGEDMNPACFHQENKGSKLFDDRLDVIDKIVIDYAVKTKKPILGICRGHQVLNVFLGGDLIQDIGQSHQAVRHMVTTYPNRLINFPTTMEINSYHHQVLDKLAPGLITIAKSKEGYNEAFIHETLPIMSFQWHPEKVPNEKSSLLIFKTFKSLFNK
ncbi:MAG: type 1 glutamine amidotransferase [Bacilli bacterium]